MDMSTLAHGAPRKQRLRLDPQAPVSHCHHGRGRAISVQLRYIESGHLHSSDPEFPFSESRATLCCTLGLSEMKRWSPRYGVRPMRTPQLRMPAGREGLHRTPEPSCSSYRCAARRIFSLEEGCGTCSVVRSIADGNSRWRVVSVSDVPRVFFLSLSPRALRTDLVCLSIL